MSENKNRGLTGEPEKALGPARENITLAAFGRYWPLVPHYGILKAEAWPMWLDFLEFWAAYPRRLAKVLAWRAWLKMQPVLTDVLKALEWQKECEQWLKDDGAFIPMPATYLNQMRHEDECPYFAREVLEIKPIDAKRYTHTADGEKIEGEEDADL